MPDMLENAEQLGKQLASHPSTQKYLAAQKALAADPAAQELISEFEQQAHKIGKLESELKPVEPADKHKLSDLQTKISGNDTVKTFLGGQVEYVNLLRQINQKIMAQLPVEKPAAEASA